ncbi:MAG TPA: alpha/beta hydrolase [Clostridia bacterium]|nr:alpha/beta hydrolase [Clostridia bacterium]
MDDNLNFVQFGEGHDVVFLHGWGGSIASFQGIAEYLKGGFRDTLLDFYGFGGTPESKRPLTLSDYAECVVSLMNKLGIPSAHFVCHSFGGRVGIRLAFSYPHLVDKLVLIDSAGIKPRRGIRYYCKIIIHKVLKRFGRGLSGSSDYRALSPVMKQTFKNIVNCDQSREAAKVRSETAIFWGKNDEITKSYMARKLKRKIKKSALFYLEGGHFAYLTDTKFPLILKAFLEAKWLSY